MMRFYTLATLSTTMAFTAMPLYAQSTNQTNGSTSSPAQQSSQTNGTSPRQALIQDLQKAGFTNVRVEPEAFIVHAVNDQGKPVLMRIGPDTVEEVTGVDQGNNSNQTMNGSQHNGAHNKMQ